MNLYFQNSQGKKRIIAKNLSDKRQISEEINKFLKKHNFKCYYTRCWYDGEYTVYDVGSWTEFFLVDDNVMESESDV